MLSSLSLSPLQANFVDQAHFESSEDLLYLVQTLSPHDALQELKSLGLVVGQAVKVLRKLNSVRVPPGAIITFTAV